MTVVFRFLPGALVRVRKGAPLGHTRTPAYLRARTGVVERHCGSFPNPEERAYHRDGLPEVPLYRVRFSMNELWQGPGESGDTLDAEIYEHWLEPVSAA